jgi:hypothetical protein
MPLNIRLALGLAGVPPNDTPKSQQWEKRLHWPVVIATLLAIPAFYLTELSGEVHLRELGRAMDAIVLLTFALELAIMLAACRQKKRYLIYNWLTVAIVLATGISVLLPDRIVPADAACHRQPAGCSNRAFVSCNYAGVHSIYPDDRVRTDASRRRWLLFA